MNFGVPRERHHDEDRVPLTPSVAHALVEAGHHVYLERGAGRGAGFEDEEYRALGVEVVYSAEEAYRRAEVVLRITRPEADEVGLLSEGQVLMAFLHLAAADPGVVEMLRATGVTAIGYETVQEADGSLPLLRTSSEIAGRLAPILAGEYLSNFHGGRGILLNGSPGIPPADVVILGAGTLGQTAARAFAGLGAQVTVLDRRLEALQTLEAQLPGRVVTLLATPYNIAKAVSYADVLVGAVLVPGQRTPILVTREMLRSMRPRSLILDFSIDQGGCVETSRPTYHRDPIFVEEGILHYCVPNVPARVARTSSHALANALLPYLLELGERGVEEGVRQVPALRRGVNLYRGRWAHPGVAAARGVEPEVDLS